MLRFCIGLEGKMDLRVRAAGEEVTGGGCIHDFLRCEGVARNSSIGGDGSGGPGVLALGAWRGRVQSLIRHRLRPAPRMGFICFLHVWRCVKQWHPAPPPAQHCAALPANDGTFSLGSGTHAPPPPPPLHPIMNPPAPSKLPPATTVQSHPDTIPCHLHTGPTTPLPQPLLDIAEALVGYGGEAGREVTAGLP